MLDKIIEIIMTILPFLGNSRKKRQMMAQEVKEFSELVKDQYFSDAAVGESVEGLFRP